jgi:hypothetical protein
LRSAQSGTGIGRDESTTARGRVWLAGTSDHGPWWLATDHPGVAAEFGRGLDAPGPGLAVYRFADKRGLYDALDRAYRLGASLPDAPLTEFKRQTAGLPRSTEAERLVVQRVGQVGCRLRRWLGNVRRWRRRPLRPNRFDRSPAYA